MATHQAALTYLPGSAKGFEAVTIDEKLTVIGDVKGKKNYELLQQKIKDLTKKIDSPEQKGERTKLQKQKQALEDQLKNMNITINNKNVIIVTPDHVKTKIIINDHIPNVVSGRGGITQKIFENIEIKQATDLQSALNNLFRPDEEQYFSGTYLIKSLVVGNEKYTNVFVKRKGDDSGSPKTKLEFYYQDKTGKWVLPEKTDRKIEEINSEIENLKKTYEAEVDTAKIERKKLEDRRNWKVGEMEKDEAKN